MEQLVREGRVRVNGQLVVDLATTIDVENDRVEVDGKFVTAASAHRVLMLHKTEGVVCSFRRQGDTPCLADVLGAELQKGRLFHVGRLDRDTTGLLLLSDDGDLAHHLLHPSKPVFKRYRLQLDRTLTDVQLRHLSEGDIVLDGRPCAPARIRAMGGDSYLMELREGRNRQIRRMVEAVGHRVVRLHREAFGPLELGALPAGDLRELEADEIGALRKAAGLPPQPHEN